MPNIETVEFEKVVKQVLFRAGIAVENPQVSQYPDIQALLNLRLRECWEYATWDFLVNIREVVPNVLRINGAPNAAFNGLYELRGEVAGKPRWSKVGEAHTPTPGKQISWVVEQNQPQNSGYWRVAENFMTIYQTPMVPVDEVQWPWDLSWEINPGDPVAGFSVSIARAEIVAGEDEHVIGLYLENPKDHPTDPVPMRYISSGRLTWEGPVVGPVYLGSIPDAPDWTTDDPQPGVPKPFFLPSVELAYSDQLEQDGQHAKSQKALARGYGLLEQLANRWAQSTTTGRMRIKSNRGQPYYY